MYKKHTLWISLIIFNCIIKCQINFEQQINVSVIKDNVELKNPWSGGLNFCQFSKIDLNLDGIEDLFVFDKSGKNGTQNGAKISTFLFNNFSNEFIFSPEYSSYFPELRDWVLLIDFDLDGKKDIFTSQNSSVAVYKNISENEVLEFEFLKIIKSDAGFGPINLYVSGSDIPAIVDVDGDSDIDILTFDPSGSKVYFHENKTMQMYGNCDSINMVRSDNCWGKFVEDFSTNSVTLGLDENCNEVNENSRFAKHSGSTLLALDLNPDVNQSLELLLGDLTYDNMVMLYNGGTQNEAAISNQDLNYPSYDIPINLTKFPAAFNLDVNNDNLDDILINPNGVNVSENFNNVHLYVNSGQNEDGEIQFNYSSNDFLIGSMIDVGANSKPLLYDLNDDNLKDLIICNKGYFDNGNYNSKISLYKNTGTLTNPIFEFVTNDFAELSSIGNQSGFQSLSASFGDLNNDNLTDMIVGDNNGQIYLFSSLGLNDSNFPEFENYEVLDIDVGSFATPQLVDLNRDGLLDLVIGERMGIDNGILNGINYYQNIGTINDPNFADFTPTFNTGIIDSNGSEIIIKSLGGIHLADTIYLTGYTDPHVFEYENKFLLAVGTERGNVHLYENVEEINENGDYELNLEYEYSEVSDNMLGDTNCIHSKIFISDINNDGYIDLVRGNSSGGVEFFSENNLNSNGNEFENLKVKLFPNPSSGNFSIKFDKRFDGQIIIYNLLGKEVLNESIINEDIVFFNVSFKKGIYFVKLKSKKTEINHKLVIK